MRSAKEKNKKREFSLILMKLPGFRNVFNFTPIYKILLQACARKWVILR